MSSESLLAEVNRKLDILMNPPAKKKEQRSDEEILLEIRRMRTLKFLRKNK